EAAPRRALHTRESRRAALRVHRRRSRHLAAAVERVDPAGADRRADVRIRLPRGELRADWRAPGCPLSGEAGGQADGETTMKRSVGWIVIAIGMMAMASAPRLPAQPASPAIYMSD